MGKRGYEVRVGRGKNRRNYKGVTTYKKYAKKWLKEAKKKGLHNPRLREF